MDYIELHNQSIRNFLENIDSIEKDLAKRLDYRKVYLYNVCTGEVIVADKFIDNKLNYVPGGSNTFIHIERTIGNDTVLIASIFGKFVIFNKSKFPKDIRFQFMSTPITELDVVVTINIINNIK